MTWRSNFLFITFGLIFAAAQATTPPLEPLHDVFAAHDRRIDQEQVSWQASYRQALELAKSSQPEQALPRFEALLTTLADQEIPFSQVYARYFTLAEQLRQRPHTARFLQDLARRHPTPWVLGSLSETQALVETREQTQALFARLQARQDQPELAADLQTLYLLLWPYGNVGEAEDKAAMADELAIVLGEATDREGIDRLARWRYQPSPDSAEPDLASRQTALEQALRTGQHAAVVVAFSHYLAALIAGNRLEDGVRWVQANQTAKGASPALPLIADVLATTLGNQRRYAQALATLAAERQSAPDSLLLALTDSTLRFFTPTQGYAQADAVLAAFGQRQPHDARVQRAVRFHRAMLASWAKQPGRLKRDTFPAIVVTATRPRDSVIHEGGNAAVSGSTARSRHRDEDYRPAGCGNQHRPAAEPTPVVRIVPRLPPPPKAKPTPKADNAATAPQLGKQLASEAQLAELRSTGGTPMAGHQLDKPIRDVNRLVAEHGGRAADWRKISSRSYTATDGTRFEIHAYWNTVTKQLVEPKSIVIRTP